MVAGCKRLQLPRDFRYAAEESDALLHRHLQHIIDTLSLIFDLQCLPVIAMSFANLTGNVDIRQKVHLNLDDAVALAGFAASALDIEGEAPGIEPAHFGIRR